MVAGILNLIFFNDLTVKEYFRVLNEAQVHSVAPALPASSEPVNREDDPDKSK